MNVRKESFFISALISVLVLRSSIFFSRFFMPETHLVVYGYIVHHFWFGFPIMILGLLVYSRHSALGSVLLGVGFGPVVDELAFMFFGGGGYDRYWALPSVIGMLVCFGVLFIFRRKMQILAKAIFQGSTG